MNRFAYLIFAYICNNLSGQVFVHLYLDFLLLCVQTKSFQHLKPPLYLLSLQHLNLCLFNMKKRCFATGLATHCINDFTLVELIATIYFQLLCNSLMTTTIMACWCHFSSIRQNLTHGTMRIFGWMFFKILISIEHYSF